MGVTGNQGIDVRQTGNRLVFRASLKDSSGVKVSTGTTTLALLELQDDGTFKTYDWTSNTFKASGMTSSASTATMTHRNRITDADANVTTGVWTNVLSTLTGFTAGAVYVAQVTNSGASPTDQEREFQYGGAQGDLRLNAVSTGVADLKVDVVSIAETNQTAGDVVDKASTLQTTIGAAGAGLTSVKLAAAGLDAISMADPGAAANITTFPKALVWLFRRFFKKCVLDSNAGTIKTYADDNTTVNVTQAITDTGTAQTQGPAA